MPHNYSCHLLYLHKNPEKIEKYLEETKIKKIEEETIKSLNDPFSTLEIQRAIRKAKNGKSPGALFYKKIEKNLIEPMKNLMNKITEKGEIPKSWEEAFITVIPKQGADTNRIKNFRPISLLNNDYKIFADLLAMRMKKVMENLINKDQSSFLPKRFMHNKIERQNKNLFLE